MVGLNKIQRLTLHQTLYNDAGAHIMHMAEKFTAPNVKMTTLVESTLARSEHLCPPVW
jgi:hypothetical protein